MFVQHSLIHSHNFFRVLGKCKCWTVCFFDFGQQELNNCFWMIRAALTRAGLCDLCGLIR